MKEPAENWWFKVDSLISPALGFFWRTGQGSIYLTLAHQVFLCKRENHTTLARTLVRYPVENRSHRL
jgi:hypothetical protein